MNVRHARTGATVILALCALVTLALFGAIFGGCATTPAPTVTPQTAPVLVARRLAMTITPAEAVCVLTPRGDRAVEAITATGTGHVTFAVPAIPGWGADRVCSAPGYVTAHDWIDGLPLTDSELPALTLAREVVALPRLVPVGQFFRLETGERWTWIGKTSFNLLNRFRNDEDIEPVLRQLESIGFNELRVFTVYDICPTGVNAEGRPCQVIGRSAPTPDLYSAIPRFATALARHHLRAELVAFTGPYVFFPTDDAKVQHWESFIAATHDLTNITRELVNEFDHEANDDLPYARLRWPRDGVLTSHGSGTQDVVPLQEFWDYITYHPSSSEGWRKAGHNAWEIAEWAHLPVVSNETFRFPDQDASPEHAFDAAAGATLFAGGAVFHSVSGKAGQLLSPTEEALARAWVAGAKSIPLTCQGQPYRHLDDGPYLRVYQMGNDPACQLRIRH